MYATFFFFEVTGFLQKRLRHKVPFFIDSTRFLVLFFFFTRARIVKEGEGKLIVL